MNRAIICFTRIPAPGQTKTRLMPFLSGEECAELHTAFLKDIAAVCAQVDADLFLAYTPSEGAEPLLVLFPDAKGAFPQQGDDLGLRMHNALCYVLSLGYDRCVLIGADIPLIDTSHFEGAFQMLQTSDITFGPVADGGYFLVGLKEPCIEIFQNQIYGTGTVLERTIAAASAAGKRVSLSPSTRDVDTQEDLIFLWSQVKGSQTATAGCLTKLFQRRKCYL